MKSTLFNKVKKYDKTYSKLKVMTNAFLLCKADLELQFEVCIIDKFLETKAFLHILISINTKLYRCELSEYINLQIKNIRYLTYLVFIYVCIYIFMVDHFLLCLKTGLV